MLAAVRGFNKALFTTRLNSRGGTLYDGIEVYMIKDNTETRYGVGNRPLNEYDSSDEDDQRYAHKIRHYLDKAGILYDPRTKIILNQKNFDKFVDAVAPKSYFGEAATTSYDPNSFRAAAPAPAPAPPEPEPTFALENGPIGSRKMLLYYKGIPKDFKMDKSLAIDVPVGPKSPISKLIFFGNAGEITIKYVLKPDAMSYCAMARYDAVNQFAPTRDGELNHEFPPSITKKLHLLKKGKKEELDTQIRTMIAKIESYANDCAAEKDVMDNGHAYYTDVRSAHVPDPIKRRILGLFGRPSSPVVDDLAGRMSEVTPMGGVARPPSSSSSDL
jgi:hypothetical protein